MYRYRYIYRYWVGKGIGTVKVIGTSMGIGRCTNAGNDTSKGMGTSAGICTGEHTGTVKIEWYIIQFLILKWVHDISADTSNRYIYRYRYLC